MAMIRRRRRSSSSSNSSSDGGLVDVAYMKPNELTELLASIDSTTVLTTEFLLIDCRDCKSYTYGHIQGAHHLNLAKILCERLRRQHSIGKGSFQLEKLFMTPEGRKSYRDFNENDRKMKVLLYNRCGDYKANALVNIDVIQLLIDVLKESSNEHNVYWLEGGFDAFFQCSPLLCYIKSTPLEQIAPSPWNVLGINCDPQPLSMEMLLAVPPAEVVPDLLFLGNIRHAGNAELLHSLGISYILDLTTENDSRHPMLERLNASTMADIPSVTSSSTDLTHSSTTLDMWPSACMKSPWSASSCTHNNDEDFVEFQSFASSNGQRSRCCANSYSEDVHEMLPPTLNMKALHLSSLSSPRNSPNIQKPIAHRKKNLSLPLRDSLGEDLVGRLNEVFAFIDEARATNSRVLVHCLAGVSRSAAICIAYMMYASHLSFEDAYCHVRCLKPSISINLNFAAQLKVSEDIIASGCKPVFPNTCGIDSATLAEETRPFLVYM